MVELTSFVIHLERAEARKAHVMRLLNTLPEAQMVPAVDGAASPDLVAAVMGTNLHKPDYPFGLNAGEVGCFLSHRAIWQRMVDNGIEAALIFEDDAKIVPEHFLRSLALAKAHIETLDYIQFQTREVADGAVLAEDGSTRLVRPVVTPLRSSAQMLSRKAAARLLDVTDKIDRPVDTFLQMHWITGLHLACVTPSGVEDRTRELGGSTLSRKKPAGAKIKREFQRHSYRRKVARYSQQSAAS